jgi:hypothetical protein
MQQIGWLELLDWQPVLVIRLSFLSLLCMDCLYQTWKPFLWSMKEIITMIGNLLGSASEDVSELGSNIFLTF